MVIAIAIERNLRQYNGPVERLPMTYAATAIALSAVRSKRVMGGRE
ncbi:MAG: hypothetical protein HC769_25435 [Cyanobacteria bacterium CRU_2_1]|nr:hypothetical protein [Cyanobacteria bacterium RU_5_0]NJR61878.1 hypothetical protein [Cyanobacteria bacterium CRU_2_1]